MKYRYRPVSPHEPLSFSEPTFSHPSANKGVSSLLLARTLQHLGMIEKDQILVQTLSNHLFFDGVEEGTLDEMKEKEALRKLLEIALHDKNMQAILILVKLLLCQEQVRGVALLSIP